MNHTLQEVNLTNKTVVLNKSTYYNNKETINSVSLTEVSSEVNQFLSFIKLIPSNLLERFDTEEKKINFLRKLYLDSYANLIQKFIKSQNNSIFLKSKQDYKFDNTLPNYLFDIFVERIKNLSISYYQSLIEILSEEIEILSENGEELIDPINKQKVIFELPITNANKEQNFINYLKNIFDKEFISISENFNSFFKVKLSKGDKKITLSNLITTKQFFIDSLPVISRFELNQIDKSNLMFYVDIKNEESKTNSSVTN